jgi:hypothetical protein
MTSATRSDSYIPADELATLQAFEDQLATEAADLLLAVGPDVFQAIRSYAALFATIQLSRVSQNFFREARYSLANAVKEQVSKL